MRFQSLLSWISVNGLVSCCLNARPASRQRFQSLLSWISVNGRAAGGRVGSVAGVSILVVVDLGQRRQRLISAKPRSLQVSILVVVDLGQRRFEQGDEGIAAAVFQSLLSWISVNGGSHVPT